MNNLGGHYGLLVWEFIPLIENLPKLIPKKTGTEYDIQNSFFYDIDFNYHLSANNTAKNHDVGRTILNKLIPYRLHKTLLQTLYRPIFNENKDQHQVTTIQCLFSLNIKLHLTDSVLTK